MLAFRKAKIHAHRKALLEQSRRSDDSDGELSDHVRRGTGGGRSGASGVGAARGGKLSHPYLRMGLTEVPLEMHVSQGVIARLEPYHLPLLLIYTLSLLLISESSRLPSAARHLGNAGTAIVNALSMVSGLLLSYESNSALGKWEQGRKVWVGVRAQIRSGTRMISLLHPTEDPLSPTWTEIPSCPNSEERSRRSEFEAKGEVAHARAEELSALLVVFAFALQYHLKKVRAPLTQPPFIDLLPPSYLSTLKRTDSSVRFAEKHMEGVNYTSKAPPSPLNIKPGGKTRTPSPGSDHRPGSPGGRGRMGGHQAKRGRKRSSVGLKMGKAISGPGPGAEDVEMERLATTTEEEEIDESGGAGAPVDETEDSDLSPTSGDNLDHQAAEHRSTIDRQLGQLNVPPVVTGLGPLLEDTAPRLAPQALRTDIPKPSQLRLSPSLSITRSSSPALSDATSPRHHPRIKTKGVLANKPAGNLPLAILRMMEAYVNGLVQMGEISSYLRQEDAGGRGREAARTNARIGWTASQGEKGHGMIKQLGDLLGEAEMLADAAPPLAHSLHLTHILVLVLMAIPAQLLPLLGRWTIPVALISGWSLLGMQALSKEVGGVFGLGDNNLPTNRYCADILSESLDISDVLKQMYVKRIEVRCGSRELGRLGSGSTENALALLKERRVENWTPNFDT